MTSGSILLVAIGLVAGSGALLGVAEAVHGPPPYMDRSFANELAVFEGGVAPEAWKADNRNGPAGQASRPIPASSDLPPSFHGLADILTAPGRVPGEVLVADHRLYASAVEAGTHVPTGVYVASATGAPRTSPTSMQFLWHGYWRDVTGDGIFDDSRCTTSGYCAAYDEFDWRGENTGDTLAAFGWIFPGDYDPSGGVLYPHVSALAGDCDATGGSGACPTPLPDFAYTDGTSPSNPSPGWAAGWGGGAVTAEEFLLVSQHIVTVVGPASELGGWPTAPTCPGCMRDYDWYDSLAEDSAESLFLSTMRTVRDALWVVDPCTCDPPPCDLCESGTPPPPGTVRPDGAEKAAYLAQEFVWVAPAAASTPPPSWQAAACARIGSPTCPSFPASGFYGDLSVHRKVAGEPLPPGILRPALHGWLWTDADEDGRIDPGEREARAQGYVGKRVFVTPGPGGWPPGAALLRDYDNPYAHDPIGGDGTGTVEPLPVGGLEPVALRVDTDSCLLLPTCRTRDALFLPTGSALGLRGQVEGGATLSWTEGASSFAIASSGAFEA